MTMFDIDPAHKTVCINCVGDAHLKKIISAHPRHRNFCTYCQTEGHSIDLVDLAHVFEKAFSYSYTEIDESLAEDHGYPTKGEDLFTIIWKEITPVDELIADDLSKIIYSFWENVSIFQSNPTSDTSFIKAGAAEAWFEQYWASMNYSLKNENRFLNSEALDLLKMVFDEIDKVPTTDGKSLILEITPEHELSTLYRARLFQHDNDLEEALLDPEKELGPPPYPKATAGRMNAKGISVFYGANLPEVALAEVRPPVGSKVAIAKFKVIREVRLLDLTRFKEVVSEFDYSIFDKQSLNKARRQKFLTKLEEELVKPVMPEHSDAGYLVTQVIADFLASHQVLNLDGVIFRSIQVANKYSKPPMNIVLFNKASIVMRTFNKPGRKFTSSLYTLYENGDVIYDPEISYFEHGDSSNNNGYLFDGKLHTLQLISDSIQIREIENVEYGVNTKSVRIEKGN